MRTELELIADAQNHPDDEIANLAMNELRTRFDSTYFWCNDCDGLVTTKEKCCLNIEQNDIDINYDEIKPEDS